MARLENGRRSVSADTVSLHTVGSQFDEESSFGSDSEINGFTSRQTDKYGFIGGAQQYSAESAQDVPAEVLRQREVKWLDMLSHWDKWVSKRFKKVRLRCQKGIPPSLRGRAWLYLSGGKVKKEQNTGTFNELDAMQGDPKWLDVIDRDLHRQFPFHEMFVSRGGHGQQDLQRVLKAYTLYRPEEGYCQAQAPIAAVLLMHMPAEDAFWVLVQICEKYLPGYYSAGLEAIQLDGQILFALLKRVSPMAHRHLDKHKMEPILYMTEWFMCAFSRTLPWASVLRIWDMFLCDGVKIIFRVGLVLLRCMLGSRERLKSCPGQYETMEHLRTLDPAVLQEGFLVYQVLECPVSARAVEREHRVQLKRWRKTHGELSYKSAPRMHGARAIMASEPHSRQDLRQNPTIVVEYPPAPPPSLKKKRGTLRKGGAPTLDVPNPYSLPADLASTPEPPLPGDQPSWQPPPPPTTVMESSATVMESSATVMESSATVMESSATVMESSATVMESSATVMESPATTIEQPPTDEYLLLPPPVATSQLSAWQPSLTEPSVESTTIMTVINESAEQGLDDDQPPSSGQRSTLEEPAPPLTDKPPPSPQQPRATGQPPPSPRQLATNSRLPPSPRQLSTNSRLPPSPRQLSTNSQPPPSPRQLLTNCQPPPSPQQLSTKSQPPPSPQQLLTNSRSPSPPRQLSINSQPPPSPRQLSTNSQPPPSPRQLSTNSQPPPSPRQLSTNSQPPPSPRQLSTHSQLPPSPPQPSVTQQAPSPQPPSPANQLEPPASTSPPDRLLAGLLSQSQYTSDPLPPPPSPSLTNHILTISPELPLDDLPPPPPEYTDWRPHLIDTPPHPRSPAPVISTPPPPRAPSPSPDLPEDPSAFPGNTVPVEETPTVVTEDAVTPGNPPATPEPSPRRNSTHSTNSREEDTYL